MDYLIALLEYTSKFEVEFAAAIAEEHYGIRAVARSLPSERDQNFLLTDASGEKFVLKIANAREAREFVEAQNAVLRHLEKRVSFCQRLALSLSGEETVAVRGADGGDHLVRVVRYLAGVPLANIQPQTPELLRDLGRKLGELDRALADFDHPAVHRDFHWDLANGNRVIDEYAGLIANSALRELARNCRFHFNGNLRRSVIHGDANDYNVLVDPERMTVVGLIDFGDMVYSYTVGNIAIAIAYVVLEKDDPGASARFVLDGYTREFSLMPTELSVLSDLVKLRLAMSVCLAAKQQSEQPENEYLQISQRAIAKTLPKLATDFHR